MGFTSIPSSYVAVDAPDDVTYRGYIKDSLDYLYGGASAQGLLNPSFEIDSDADGEPDSWTISTYPSGTFNLEDADNNTSIHGAACIKFTHPSGASNGGGSATTDYLPCEGGVDITVGFSIKVSATGAKNEVIIEYYDKDQVTISSDDTIYTSTVGPTSWTPLIYASTVPATARFYKIKLIGGFTDTDPGASRDTYFDHIWAGFVISSVNQMGANIVGQTQMIDSAIGQAECKTTTGEVSAANTLAHLTLPGGSYGFYPQIKGAGSSSSTGQISTQFLITAYYTNITLDSTGGAGTAYAQQRYFQASPPYNLGDGDIPLFLFCLVHKASRVVEAIYSAPEAPWHYNGPTKVSPDFYKDGKPYKRVKSAFDKMKFDKEIITVSEVEITQAIKNADMNLIPHPFSGINTLTHEVVLIDPVADMTWKMREAFEDNLSDLHELLYAGDLVIDNTVLNRVAPVNCYKVKWK